MNPFGAPRQGVVVNAVGNTAGGTTAGGFVAPGLGLLDWTPPPFDLVDRQHGTLVDPIKDMPLTILP